MALFWAAIWRDSVSSQMFPFLSHLQVFSCKTSPVCYLKWPHNCFSFYFCFQVVFIRFIRVLSILFLVAVMSLPPHFFIHLLFIDASIVSRMLTTTLPLSFLTHLVCVYHLWDLRPHASSWIFLFSGPFVRVLLWPSLRMAPTILWGRQLKYLSL